MQEKIPEQGGLDKLEDSSHQLFSGEKCCGDFLPPAEFRTDK